MNTEQKVKHTPGPWGIEGGYIVHYDKGLNNAPFAVAKIDTGWDMTGEEKKSNAKLIAAAPELLEALQEAVTSEEEKYASDCQYASVHNNLDGVGIHFDYYSPYPMPEWVEKAKAAIKRATE